MTQETQPQQWVWITGASSGIGLSLVKRHLADGWHVIASARSAGELETLLDSVPHLHFIPLDVTDKGQLSRCQQAISDLTPYLDRVILNAGNCEYLDIEKPDWSLHERINAVNYLGMVNCVEVCLPLLKISPRGHLVGIGSQAVQAPFPRAEGYGASKAAVRYFLSALRMDVAQYGIDVTCVLPGFVDTPLTQKNDFSMPFIMSAEQASERIYRALEKRPFEYAFPKRLSMVLTLARCLPKLWLRLNATKPIND
ncbi:SDR family NAD(P)-dependent oxidoreductase [Maribrevibacterium harenarium]|uniref:SDR family NAD(P)-dependent oxidoreductase n=1 Tax=Maribrevibacterium harenarium TaxID=2589817 RepID=A0A501WX59_9GAMM|nr:SDR family NAD(P)-dependent oxidoreductase [Maribrevibacterium harenarium]TPE54058.1 SDR family NAD(P)-dependent oxidoreductase [Maribrevibacterium harenarium]